MSTYQERRTEVASAILSGMVQAYTVAYGSPTNKPDEMIKESISLADGLILKLEVSEKDFNKSLQDIRVKKMVVNRYCA